MIGRRIIGWDVQREVGFGSVQHNYSVLVHLLCSFIPGGGGGFGTGYIS